MNYEHYNRALGKYITSKRQYDEEMKRGGYITYDECKDKAKSYKEKRATSNHKPAEDTLEFISSIKLSARNNKIKLSDRQIDFLKKKGVNFDAQVPQDGSRL